MDGILMKELHGNLNLLSDESMKTLLNYYASGTLSLEDRNLLLNEITKRRDTSKDVPLPNLKS
jgi:hypothetical protein